MPFNQVFSYYPAPGKQGELLALLRGRIQARHAAGDRASLHSQNFGDDARFMMLINVPDLDAIEKLLDGLRTDPAVAEFGRASAALMRRPIRAELWESLIPAQGGRWGFGITNWPVTGRQGELRALIEERLAVEQAASVTCGLMQAVTGDDGLAFLSYYRFNALGDFGKFRERRRADAAFAEGAKKLRELTIRPARSELVETLMPFPS